MLHETLLALLGCTGDVFVDAPPECAPLAASSRLSMSLRAENPVAHALSCRALRRPRAVADGGAVDGEGPLDEPRIVVAADVAVEAPEREALNRLARPRRAALRCVRKRA
jgi:hypothetical protein